MISHGDPEENTPRQLLGEEVIHPSESDELREGTGQAEAVRQPGGLATDSESTLEVTLTEDHLAGQTFTGRHICVVFYPGTTDRVELALEDLGLDTFEQLWVEFFEPLVLLYVFHSQRGSGDMP